LPLSGRQSSASARPTAAAVRRALRAQADPVRARNVARFFKCGPGDYGEGDRFIGVTVPAQRAVARRFRDLPLDEADTLLQSAIHEERLTALLVLVHQFTRSNDERLRRRIFALYRKRLRHVDNWDLVDSSAEHIVGGWLADKPRDTLDRLARSSHLWSRRVAMLATFHYVKRGDHRDAMRIAAILLHDRHDLIHKAVGWMLREVGKRASAEALTAFLERHAATMPRTMLRYAIERLPAGERAAWMARGQARRAAAEQAGAPST
jgi:3-methyladenine DNA glycosylase AlkD